MHRSKRPTTERRAIWVRYCVRWASLALKHQVTSRSINSPALEPYVGIDVISEPMLAIALEGIRARRLYNGESKKHSSR